MKIRNDPLKLGIVGMLLSGIIGYSVALTGYELGSYYNNRFQKTRSTEDFNQAKMYSEINCYSLMGTAIAVSGCALSSLSAHVYRKVKGGE